MSTPDNTAEILDFTQFRQQRDQVQQQNAVAPQYMWYPVWVLVPVPTPTPSA